jgi:hypothetical protein
MAQRKVNWAGQGANPFDAIAIPVKATKGKTTKIIATVTDEIREAVDRLIGKKATLAAVKAEVDQLDSQIIDHVREQQERLARAGNYSKSFEVHGMPRQVEGNNIPVEATLTYTTMDKFSVTKDLAAQAELKEMLKDRFDEFLIKKRSISLKPEIQLDMKFLQKFAKALADAGISLAETFDVVDILEAKPDLDKNQFELTPREHEIFKNHVKQTKPSLK